MVLMTKSVMTSGQVTIKEDNNNEINFLFTQKASLKSKS